VLTFMDHNTYVEQHDGGYWISGTRVSLDSVAIAFQQGFSPEAIARDCFPTLTLEQVYGAITYYLAHRAEIDSYLERSDAEYETLRQQTHAAARPLLTKLAAARERLLAAKS
jgi:uncharacterized protein (DUF433 family)